MRSYPDTDDVPETDAEMAAPIDGKPACQLTGTDGNVFNVIATVSRCLTDAGLRDRAGEWRAEASQAGSHDEVLQTLHGYVDAR